MPPKSERLQIRLTPEDRAILGLLAVDMNQDDMSACIRVLVREKARERGIVLAPPAAAKKKRRAAP